MIGNFARRAMLCTMPAVVAAAVFASAHAQAGAISSYRVLHAFCQATSCADGALASGAPAMDANGDLFGVTAFGGRFGGGALYELVPKHGGARYFKHVLKAFLRSGLLQRQRRARSDADHGRLGQSLRHDDGPPEIVRRAVYMKSAEPQLHVLHIFEGADGCHPTPGSLVYQGSASGQAYDGVSPLYGMTADGGTNNEGAVYELTPPQPGSNKWGARTIYSFCHISDCADGVNPQGKSGDGRVRRSARRDIGRPDLRAFAGRQRGLRLSCHLPLEHGETYAGFALASDGNTLFGIASSGGGSPAGGTLFSLTPGCRACSARQFIYTPLHTFCSGGGSCADGNAPDAIVLDPQGDVFGITERGGANPAPPGVPASGAGTVFRIYPHRIVPHALQFLRPGQLRDGGNPLGGLLLNNGLLYGTTSFGGSTANLPTGAGVRVRGYRCPDGSGPHHPRVRPVGIALRNASRCACTNGTYFRGARLTSKKSRPAIDGRGAGPLISARIRRVGHDGDFFMARSMTTT